MNSLNASQLIEMAKSNIDETASSKLLFTVKEAACFLSLSRSTIYNLMEAGKLRYVKFGSARRIPLTCCNELITSQLAGGWALNVFNRDVTK